MITQHVEGIFNMFWVHSGSYKCIWTFCHTHTLAKDEKFPRFKKVDFRHPKSQFLFFSENWIWCFQCVGVTERSYALVRPRMNSKHVKYTFNMLSNHGKHLKKVSRKKKLKSIFDTWNPFFEHSNFREFLISATTS